MQTSQTCGYIRGSNRLNFTIYLIIFYSHTKNNGRDIKSSKAITIIYNFQKYSLAPEQSRRTFEGYGQPSHAITITATDYAFILREWCLRLAIILEKRTFFGMIDPRQIRGHRATHVPKIHPSTSPLWKSPPPPPDKTKLRSKDSYQQSPHSKLICFEKKSYLSAVQAKIFLGWRSRTREYFKLSGGVLVGCCETTEEEQRTMTIVSHTHSMPSISAAANSDVMLFQRRAALRTNASESCGADSMNKLQCRLSRNLGTEKCHSLILEIFYVKYVLHNSSTVIMIMRNNTFV